MQIRFPWLFPFVAVFLLSACTSSDTTEKTYADAAALRADGAIERGWVSAELPQRATDIRLKIDIDTNEVWAKFAAPAEGMEILSRACSKDKLHSTDLPSRSPGAWWPDDLLASNFAAGPVNYFRCADGGRFSTPSSHSAVHFWRLTPGPSH